MMLHESDNSRVMLRLDWKIATSSKPSVTHYKYDPLHLLIVAEIMKIVDRKAVVARFTFLFCANSLIDFSVFHFAALLTLTRK